MFHVSHLDLRHVAVPVLANEQDVEHADYAAVDEIHQ
jgi:hypothetical protein